MILINKQLRDSKIFVSNQIMKSKISVVHLVYVPFGVDLFKRFLDSYVKHPSGIEHELIIMFNGFDKEDELKQFLEIIDSLNLDYEVVLSKEKYDVSSYFFAAKNLNSEYLLFLNSYSMILADNWLHFFYSAMQKENVGVVGASGAGWRSDLKNFWEYNNSFGSVLKEIKSFIFIGLHFGKFVCPHVRTNSFFVRRDNFLLLKYNNILTAGSFKDSSADSKNKTLYFEHGNRNMTYQFIKMGLKTLVVDRYGNSYEPEDWMSSKTFWISNQENLLVHDNRTLMYENGDEKLRKELSYAAWGI